MRTVEIALDDPQAIRIWAAIGELVQVLPGEWMLIGA